MKRICIILIYIVSFFYYSCTQFIPEAPMVTCITQSNDTTPTWTWNIPAGTIAFRYSFDENESNWTEVGIETTNFTVKDCLIDGEYSLYVQCKNIFDQWSYSGFDSITVSENNFLTSIEFNETRCGIDSESATILFPFCELDYEEINISYKPDSLGLIIDGNEIRDGDSFFLNDTNIDSEIIVSTIDSKNNILEYRLLFTKLPVVQFTTENLIMDASDVFSNFTISSSSLFSETHQNQSFSSDSFIQIRGASSQYAPKKSYAFCLADENNVISASLLDMQPDTKWILDALYYDLSKCRNKGSLDLWFSLTDFPDIDEEKNNNKIESCYVELFLNNEYKGLYVLTQHIDAEILKLSERNNDDSGALYKTIAHTGDYNPTQFENYREYDPNSLYWDGFEQSFPENPYWTPIYELVKFVSDSEDNNFKYGIKYKIDIDNAINYLLFTNLILGIDNLNKNIFYIKPDESEKLFLAPWDMDRSWGRNVEQALPVDYGVWLTNTLFDRLISTESDDFKNKLKRRWESLRSTTFSENNLINIFQNNINLLIDSGAAERDAETWPELQTNLSDELTFIESWISAHLIYLDNYINEL